MVPDPECPHFITHRLVTNAGVGHLISEYLTGIALTLQKPNATFVYTNDLGDDTWEGNRGDPVHGSLLWAEDFFRLDYGEVNLEEVKAKFNPE
jgi:hypothetical protein